MEKKLRKILGTIKYGDETWSDTLDRVNKDFGIDIKICYKLIGVILEEIERIEKANTPIIPTAFAGEPLPEVKKDHVKKTKTTKKAK